MADFNYYSYSSGKKWYSKIAAQIFQKLIYFIKINRHLRFLTKYQAFVFFWEWHEVCRNVTDISKMGEEKWEYFICIIIQNVWNQHQ